jgi:hypothetical protein
MLQQHSTKMKGCEAVAATSKEDLLHADTTERSYSCLNSRPYRQKMRQNKDKLLWAQKWGVCTAKQEDWRTRDQRESAAL